MFELSVPWGRFLKTVHPGMYRFQESDHISLGLQISEDQAYRKRFR
jgi:hypothetical protein